MQPLKILKPFQPTWNIWMLLVCLQKEKAWDSLVFKKRKLWLDNILPSAPNQVVVLSRLVVCVKLNNILCQN